MPTSELSSARRWLPDATTGRRFPSFHVLAKPVGPICNLNCRYCYYLAKEQIYPERKGMAFRMQSEVLEEFIRQYIASQSAPVVNFAWQGGEPTLLGLDFFEHVVALQRKHRPTGVQIANALQTNGTLLDDRWGAFLKANDFLVGISIDGPEELHDRFRADKGDHPSHAKVIAGLRALQRHGIDHNILTTVNSANVTYPLEIYRYLKDLGSRYLQFIPIVERPGRGPRVSPETVPAQAYGEFLCRIFDEWVRHDVGSVFIQLFDNTLSIWSGMGSPLCVFAETCGDALVLEHNGDLYSCDHFVLPEHRLGNIGELPLAGMVNSRAQVAFGIGKSESLPSQCRRCDVRFACNGECPKNRFLTTADGEPGLNYLCAAYLRFYRHVRPAMDTMTALLAAGRPPREITHIMQEADFAHAIRNARPNDPCPCGGGLKFKRCHHGDGFLKTRPPRQAEDGWGDDARDPRTLGHLHNRASRNPRRDRAV